MVMSGVFTMANNKPLVSGGECYINAKQNGQTLKLAGSNMVSMLMPNGNTNSSGSMNEFYTRNATDTTNWGTPSDSIPVVADTTAGATYAYYYVALDSMNWINCDYFTSGLNFTTVRIRLADTSFSGSNAMAVMSFNGLNVAMQPCYNFTSKEYSQFYIPIGQTITFYILGQKGTQYYSGSYTSTITGNDIVTISLATSTLNQIQTDLGNLP